MAQKVKVAATCRRCEALSEDVATAEADKAVKAYIDAVLRSVWRRKPDLIVFPEMCDLPEGWSMDCYVRYILEREDTVTEYLRKKACELKTWIAYSTVRGLRDGSLRNSCILLDRCGNTAMIYDKLYPTLGELEAGILPGEEPKILDCELGRVGAAICFDLNYTDTAGEYRKKKADMLIFPSLFHGGVLQRLWAFTARAYLVGACGGCGAGVVSPAGEILVGTTGYFSEFVYTINLDCALVHLDFNRDKLEAIMGKYADSVTMRDPGGLGSVILINERDDCSLQDILQEFGVETMDDYLHRMERAKELGKARKQEE